MPRGRPKGALSTHKAALREYCREFTEEAVKHLVTIMRAPGDDQIKLAAIRELLDRGHGKPTVGIAGEDGNPIRMTIEWLKPGA